MPLPHDGPDTQDTIDHSLQVQPLQGLSLSPPERELEPTPTQQPGVLGGNDGELLESSKRLQKIPRQRSSSRHAENVV